jgi:amidase
MRLVALPDGLESNGLHYQMSNLSKPVSALRIGVWHSDPICPPSQDVQDRVEWVASALARAGAQVDAKARPGFASEHSYSVFKQLLRAAMTSRMPQAAFDKLVARAKQLDPGDISERSQMLRHQTVSVHDWTDLNEQRARLRWMWHEFQDA